MSLLGQAEATVKLIEDLVTKRAMLEQANEFERRREQLGVPASALGPLINSITLLRENKILISGLDGASLGHWKATFERMRESFRERPESILDLPQNARQAFLDPLRRLPDQVRSVVTNSWQSWIKDHTGAISGELLRILAQIPALRDQVSNIQSSLSELEQLSQAIPKGIGEVRLVIGISGDIASRWHSLAGEGLPTEVVSFLRAAGDRGGASYEMLTPKTRYWLEEHRLLDALRLRLA